MGAEFDEVAVSVGHHAIHGGREAHGFPQVRVPVVGLQLLGDRLAGDRGVPGNRGRGGGDAVEFVEDRRAQWLDPGAVGGVVDVEPADEHLLPAEVGEQGVEGSTSPAITVERPLFTAATDTRPPRPARRASTSLCGRATTAMVPVPDIPVSAWLRRATTAAASLRLSAPATQAAATSP